MDIGNGLKKKLYQVIPGFYLAETDKYLFLFDASQYPTMNAEVFDIASKTDLMNYLTHQQ